MVVSPRNYEWQVILADRVPTVEGTVTRTRQQQRLESCGTGPMDVREHGLCCTSATVPSDWVNGVLIPIMTEGGNVPFYPKPLLQCILSIWYPTKNSIV